MPISRAPLPQGDFSPALRSALVDREHQLNDIATKLLEIRPDSVRVQIKNIRSLVNMRVRQVRAMLANKAQIREKTRTPFLLPDTMPPEIQIQREIDLERLRVRLRGMTNEELRQFGKAARYMVGPNANDVRRPGSPVMEFCAEVMAEVALGPNALIGHESD